MAWEKVGYGSLGVNKYKKEEHHPPYKGKAKLTIDGVEREVSIAAWVKENDGGKYFSISFEMEKQGAPSRQQSLPNGKSEDEIPF